MRAECIGCSRRMTLTASDSLPSESAFLMQSVENDFLSAFVRSLSIK
jgi:hypothetical protein